MNDSAGKLTKRDKTRDTVGSIAHGLNVIKAFDAEHSQLTLSQVAELTGMSRAGARRYLLTLTHLGYVNQRERLFRLSPKVLELGYAYLSSMQLSTIAQPYLESLRDQIDQTIAMAVLDDGFVVHIARANARKLMGPTLTIGRRFPALYTSTGRALIAMKSDEEIDEIITKSDLAPPTHLSLLTKKEIRTALKSVRRNGYAIVDQENELGIRSLAVPVLNRSGEAAAAIVVLTNTATVTNQKVLRGFLPLLKAAAIDIERTLVA
jgi:IclR family transcriptional regulator, pca regulon regulatory protein